MKPTLFLLAAGMGSRYGGLKQLDGLGPNGETIMDYSIYDAINAGFGKLVFVIRKDFEQDFRDKIISKYEGHIPCELVFQSIDDLPEGFTCPEGRTKPWGTNHAVMMGADVIKEPFAVINCDDFYGRDSFQVMGKFLAALPEGSKNVYSMVGFRIGNTLSFVDGLTDESFIADIGCGTGGQTMVVAGHVPGRITGIDLFPAHRFSKPKTHPIPWNRHSFTDSPQRFLNDILGLFRFTFPTPAKLPYKSGLRLTCII